MVGHFTKQIRAMQAKYRTQSEKIAASNRRGAIPKHEAVTVACEKCGKYHSINEHRFHGEVSHLRTHGDEMEGQLRYVSEFSVGKKSAASKKLGSMQKSLSKMGPGPIRTPRGRSPVMRPEGFGRASIGGAGNIMPGAFRKSPKSKGKK